MFEWAKQWLKLRRQNRPLREGKTIELFYDQDVYIFVRDFCKAICDLPNIVAINRSGQVRNLSIATDEFLPRDGQKDKNMTINTYLDVLPAGASARIKPQGGKFNLSLPPNSITAYQSGFLGSVTTGE